MELSWFVLNKPLIIVLIDSFGIILNDFCLNKIEFKSIHIHISLLYAISYHLLNAIFCYEMCSCWYSQWPAEAKNMFKFIHIYLSPKGIHFVKLVSTHKTVNQIDQSTWYRTEALKYCLMNASHFKCCSFFRFIYILNKIILRMKDGKFIGGHRTTTVSNRLYVKHQNPLKKYSQANAYI